MTDIIGFTSMDIKNITFSVNMVNHYHYNDMFLPNILFKVKPNQQFLKAIYNEYLNQDFKKWQLENLSSVE